MKYKPNLKGVDNLMRQDKCLKVVGVMVGAILLLANVIFIKNGISKRHSE